MIARIQKWGNSQGLRVARPLLEAAHLSVGEEVEVSAKGGQLVVRPLARRRKRVRIEDLVARMPKDYRSHEESFGPPRGREAW
jgi:antitoxin MazE